MTTDDDDPQAIIAIFHALRARNLSSLLEEISKQRGVLLYEICGRGRSLAVTLARHELWWKIRNHPHRRYSYPEIARLFLRDNTTIRHGVLTHQKRLLP